MNDYMNSYSVFKVDSVNSFFQLWIMLEIKVKFQGINIKLECSSSVH